jgi:hypothetical protein
MATGITQRMGVAVSEFLGITAHTRRVRLRSRSVHGHRVRCSNRAMSMCARCDGRPVRYMCGQLSAHPYTGLSSL